MAPPQPHDPLPRSGDRGIEVEAPFYCPRGHLTSLGVLTLRIRNLLPSPAASRASVAARLP